MKNPITKQMVVTNQSVINSNQLVESVALFDEAGAPVVLGAGGGFELNGEFEYSFNRTDFALTQETFDWEDYDTDTGGWTDLGGLVLPAGTYLINVNGAVSFGTPATDNWRVWLNYLEGAEMTSVPIQSSLGTGTPTFGAKNIIHLFAPTTVTGKIERAGVVEATTSLTLRIQKL